VVTWEESYLSFWVTGALLISTIITWFIPWGWLALWCPRIFVWLGMGPWMKIVDKYYVAPFELKEEDLEDLKEKRRKIVQGKKKTFLDQIKKEEQIKCRDMQIFHFGKYVVKIPGLNLERVKDIPLPESSAVPFTGKNPHRKNILVIPGRKMSGNMIQRQCVATWKDETTSFRHAQSESDTSVLSEKSLLVDANQNNLDVPQGDGSILSKVGESTPLLKGV